MADNVVLNAGSGDATFAADDIAGVHHQRVKVQQGADGSATDVSHTNPLPIEGGEAENAVAAANPVQVGGRYDATPRTLGDGDVGAVALDTDGVIHVADGGNSITVDAPVATPVNVQIGDGTDTVAVSAAGAAQVDIASALPTGSNTIGTVTANLGATDNAVLDAIQAAVEVIDNAISGTEMQVDVVAALPAGTNAIGKLAANSGVDIGDVDVLSIAAGSNPIGDVGLSGARTSGGTTLYKNIDVDESEDQIKATAGQVYWITAFNLAATKMYLKLYNATAASVVVGTTVPDLTFPLPTQGDTNGAGFVLSIPNGIAFSTAITIAATTGIADNDSGAPGANEVVVNLGYA